MIVRMWHGVVKAGSEQKYIDHLKRSTFPALNQMNGFVRAQILGSPVSDGTEFCIITQWESMQAIRSFAGPSTSDAVVPDEASALMVNYDRQVRHYQFEYELNKERDEHQQ